MTWRVALRLGRVSNLPTVWTNVLAGMLLAGGSVGDWRTLPLMLALSLLYIAGMYLNDAFDRDIDARERPGRPIPAGEVRAASVFATGFALIGAALLLLLWVGFGAAGGTGARPVLAGLALAGAVVLYDWHHKGVAWSPALMGLCRVLVYVVAGLAVAPALPPHFLIVAVVVLGYLIGLTYVARQETLSEVRNLWPLLFLAAPLIYGAVVALASPTGAGLFLALALWVVVALRYLWRRRPGDVPRAVVSLIAGIALLDGIIIATTGVPGLAWLCVPAFLLTLALQRFVPGT